MTSLQGLRGDCLACKHISECQETSLERVKESYTCSLFREVPEPVYMGRLHLIDKVGEDHGIAAILDKPLAPEPTEPEGEEHDDDDNGE